MKSKRGYRDYGVCNWLKYYFQRFTCRNTGGGCKHIHQQAQHKITPRFCEYEVVVDEYGNLGCGNCHLCDYPP